MEPTRLLTTARAGLPTLLLAVGVVPAAGATDPSEILGLWLTEGNQSIVEVREEGGAVSAHIIALENPVFLASEGTGRDGRPRTDINNVAPDLRDRPLIGLRFLSGFKFEKGEWRDGQLYDPESGNTYRAVLTLDGPTRLEVRGYIGVPWLGRTSTWQRPGGCSDLVHRLLSQSGVKHSICGQHQE